MALPTGDLWAHYNENGHTYDGSNLMSAWADQSGNGRHVDSYSASNQPLHVASIKNSLAAVRFSRPLNYESMWRNSTESAADFFHRKYYKWNEDTLSWEEA